MDSGFAPDSKFALDLSLKPKWRDTFNIPRNVDYINLGSDYCIYSWDFLRSEHSPILLRKRPHGSHYDVPGLISYCASTQTSGAARFATMVRTWKILIRRSASVAATSTYRNSSPGCQIETTKTTAKFIFLVFPREQMTTSTRYLEVISISNPSGDIIKRLPLESYTQRLLISSALARHLSFSTAMKIALQSSTKTGAP